MDGRMIFRGRPSLGVVYTKPSVVSFVLDLISYVPSKNISDKRILDVGCSYGQFIDDCAHHEEGASSQDS
jgi:2-polyprenyl-3-methyl-5-hydroxy-6-metoxy-1,4-benzoquinol methylase